MTWIYVSDGASIVESAKGERFEFFLISPREDPQHVETLAMTAHFSLDFSIHLGKVIDIGQPWIAGSEMRHLLVSLPYPFGPALEVFGNVRILWLLPVSTAEAEFVKIHGAESLESLFDEVRVDALDPFRRSVV